jgi:hypothetical protein
MILSGRPWKLVLLAGVLVAMVCGASLWLVWSEKEVPSVPARVIMTMGPVAALATLLFVLIVLRRRGGAASIGG